MFVVVIGGVLIEWLLYIGVVGFFDVVIVVFLVMFVCGMCGNVVCFLRSE